MVKTGSINMAKAIRRVGHRSGQARKMTFYRTAIQSKDEYGVESTTVAAGNEGLTIPNIDAFIAPIVTQSDSFTRAGHTVVGSAIIYIPALSTIKNNILGVSDDWNKDSIGEPTFDARLSSFNEFESNDILYDMEKVINYQPISHDVPDRPGTYSRFGSSLPCFEGDRIQFKIKNNSSTDRMTTIILSDDQDSPDGTLTWTFDDTSNPNFNDAKYHIIDLPVSGVKNLDKAYYIYVPASGATGIRTLTATVADDFDIKDCDGENRTINTVIIAVAGGASGFTSKDFYLYKAGEWRINAIKEYRDEYMKLSCAKIRGERGSRRRAYTNG